jgi:hypothetical protein
MGSRFGIQRTGNDQHPSIILRVALGMGQAAHPASSGQAAGQHRIQNTTPLPCLFGRDGGLVQLGVFVANNTHVAKYRKSRFKQS